MAHNFIEMAAVTDAGSVRQFNEDCVVTDPGSGWRSWLTAWADIVPARSPAIWRRKSSSESLRSQGHRFRSAADPHSPLRALDLSINRANTAVFEAAQAQSTYHGMGTTLALAVFYDDRVALGHIGDSRIYRLRNDALQLLTRDDSLLRDQIELGLISAVDARDSHNRSLVTQALGIAKSIHAHVREDDASPGDIFVLCSDGLNDLVEDADIELIVRALKSNLPLAAKHLVQAAKDNGGYDNVSVILARVGKPLPAANLRRWIARRFRWLR